MNSPFATPSRSEAPARLRAVIVDDEPVARRGVRLLLERDPEIEIAGEAADGAEAAKLMERVRPDVAFLDVQMPGCDGFELLRRLPAGSVPAIVFVTAHDEHALKAFDVSAVDYLLKPYEDARFFAALERAKEEARRRRGTEVNSKLMQLLEGLQQKVAPPAEASSDVADRILIKSSGEIFFVKAGEIDWIEAEGDYMKFHVAGRTHLMRETMARLEARLDPKHFVRIHRSTIVNIDRLRKLSPSFGGEYAVILQDGTKLKLSRGYHERIAVLLKQSF